MRRAVALLTALALVGCAETGNDSTWQAPALKLMSYDSCSDLLDKVRAAAKDSVGPWGFVNYYAMADGMGLERNAAGDANKGVVPPAAAPAPVQGQDYSGTNTHTAGVDEPDLVKTDGKRIVIVQNGSLHVIDAATRRQTSQLPVDQGAFEILMHGDRVLVLSNAAMGGLVDRGIAADRSMSPYPYLRQTRVQLIDLAGIPKLLDDFKIDASLVDARQIDGTARIVVSNGPTIAFPAWNGNSKEDDQLAKNRAAIDKAPLESWLPSYTTASGASGRVDCPDVSVPQTSFSGASLVTVLSFDMRINVLATPEPTSVFADGGTIYGSGPNLYLANDQSWRVWRSRTPWSNELSRKQYTEVYQFDVTTPKPVYVASGAFPGWLLNQYSMSEHDGVLRVASTDSPPWQSDGQSSSTVYMLHRENGKLAQIGSVGGMGKGERIYAVRFVGTVGYVVTFRQTDPLYTLDLSNPRRPRVIGELKIPGYSAYLHPVGEDRLIGVGQDATDRGRATGTQISLFDVGNLGDPRRLDEFKVPHGYSEAENDPHAFLYWPPTRLLVVPVNQEALLLEVGDDKLTELARINHNNDPVRRSLIIGDTLWTISYQSAVASTLDGQQRLATLSL